MSVQNTYSENMVAGKVGAIVNTEHHSAVSRTVEDASLAFGVPVARGLNDDGCKAWVAGDAFFGVSVRERSLDANSPDAFPQYESARVMKSGVIWVQASLAVSAGDPVYVVNADGAWHNAADAARTVIPGAEWDSSTTAAGLAKVRLA